MSHPHPLASRRPTGVASPTPEGRAALAELCGAYWYPIYAFRRWALTLLGTVLDQVEAEMARRGKRPLKDLFAVLGA